MARQCLLGMHGAKCAQIPYRVLSNWRQAIEINENGEDDGAALFQFDGGENTGDKFEKMRVEGHLFVDLNSIGEWNDEEKGKWENGERKAKCNGRGREQKDARGTESEGQSWRATEKRGEESANRTEKSANRTEKNRNRTEKSANRTKKSANRTKKSANRTKKSANRTMVAIHALFEWIHGLFPGIKQFLIVDLFPHYAAHILL
ncbi:hypothetical protein niasHS_002368 [Heterodera schachtii]|uniref:Uncharacterized protein n=1 Tax=Heterodera schachtii TaxID=97005 RepID=A0ABD2KK87_HETSC